MDDRSEAGTPQEDGQKLDVGYVETFPPAMAVRSARAVAAALGPALTQFTETLARVQDSTRTLETSVRPALIQFAETTARIQDSTRALAASVRPALIQFAETTARITATVGPALVQFAEGFARLQEEHRRRLIPANLHDVAFTIEALSELADEGIVLWAVPDSETARRFLDAPTYGARRAILSQRSRVILDECQATAAYAVGGRYASHARQLEQAIAAGRQGFVGPAISHLGSIIDTMLRDGLEGASRVSVVRHPSKRNPAVMDHFDELALQQAMVFRPIWFAYRPTPDRSQLALSTSFSRHAVAHSVTGPNVLSFRNFVQAAMLAAGLIDFLSWWAEAEANGILVEGLTALAVRAEPV